MMIMMKKVAKKFGALSVAVALLGVALLSVVLGCGGSAASASNNQLTIDVRVPASNANASYYVTQTLAGTIWNQSSKTLLGMSTILTSASGTVASGTPVVTTFNPQIYSGGSVAFIILYSAFNPGLTQQSSSTSIFGNASIVTPINQTIAMTITDSSNSSQAFNTKLIYVPITTTSTTGTGTNTTTSSSTNYVLSITPSDGNFYYK